MRLILFLVLMCIGQLLFAQLQLSTKSKKAAGLYKEAIERANVGVNDLASHLLRKAIDEDKNFIEAYVMLGELYNDQDKDSLAILTFRTAIQINPEFFPAIYSNLANLEFNNGMYQDALVHVQKYLTYPNQNMAYRKSAEYLQRSCLFALEAIKAPVPFNPDNLGAAINNRNDQYWPSLSADESTMVFTENLPIDSLNSDVYRNRQEDFFYSIARNNKWQKALPVGFPLNTPQNEGAQSLSADGKLMVFTGCNRPGGVGNCDLYYSRFENGRWSAPRNFGRGVNSGAKDTQPAISADGTTIYFVSNRPNGKGGLDIWSITLNADGWGTPTNLGDSINTQFDEQSPYIHPDNQTLYFSSKGWPGMGRFDLYVSRKNDKKQWATPKNLGYPINTHFDETGMVVNARGNKAYYSSNRLGGFGGDDIYSFDLPQAVQPTRVSYMKGNVYNSENNEPIQARFELIDLASGENIMDAWSNTDGTFLICLPEGKEYALNVNRPGFLFYSDNFNMVHGDFSKPYLKDVPLKPIRSGEKIVLKNIFFDVNAYVLKPESTIELDRLVKFMNENSTLQVEISGHTDNTGKPDYNIKLSENRAFAVTNYLISKGIDASRLAGKGYGSSQPVAPNETEEGRAQNRRTEFKIIKF